MTLDEISITELARLLNKSRPTVYKYITDYKSGRFDGLPASVKELFDRINGGWSKREIYAFCEVNFCEREPSPALKSIITLLIENESNLDLDRIKNYIEGEIHNGK